MQVFIIAVLLGFGSVVSVEASLLVANEQDVTEIMNVVDRAEALIWQTDRNPAGALEFRNTYFYPGQLRGELVKKLFDYRNNISPLIESAMSRTFLAIKHLDLRLGNEWILGNSPSAIVQLINHHISVVNTRTLINRECFNLPFDQLLKQTYELITYKNGTYNIELLPVLHLQWAWCAFERRENENVIEHLKLSEGSLFYLNVGPVESDFRREIKDQLDKVMGNVPVNYWDFDPTVTIPGEYSPSEFAPPHIREDRLRTPEKVQTNSAIQDAASAQKVARSLNMAFSSQDVRSPSTELPGVPTVVGRELEHSRKNSRRYKKKGVEEQYSEQKTTTVTTTTTTVVKTRVKTTSESPKSGISPTKTMPAESFPSQQEQPAPPSYSSVNVMEKPIDVLVTPKAKPVIANPVTEFKRILGNYGKLAEEHYEGRNQALAKALQLAVRHGLIEYESLAYIALGQLNIDRGSMRVAKQDFSTALAKAKRVGEGKEYSSNYLQSRALRGLGQVTQGEEALGYYNEALRMASEEDSRSAWRKDVMSVIAKLKNTYQPPHVRARNKEAAAIYSRSG